MADASEQRTGDTHLPSGVIALTLSLVLVALILIVIGRTGDPLYLAFGGFGGVIAVLFAPPSVARGVSVLSATVALIILAPTSAPFSSILVGTFLAGLYLILGLARAQRAPDQHGVTPPVIWLSVFFLIGQILSTVIMQSSNPLISVIPAVVLNILVMALALKFTVNDMRVFARGFVGLAVVQVGVALIDSFIRPIPFLGYTFVYGERLTNPLIPGEIARSQAMFGHPIIFGLVLIVASVLIWRNTVAANGIVRLLLVVVLFTGIVLSGTRSAILALAVGLVYLIVFSPRTFGGRLRNAVILVVVVTPLALNSTVRSYVLTLIDEFADSGSYTHRIGAFESVPALLSPIRDPFEVIFGSGVGAEARLYALGTLQNDGFNIVDNQLVTTLIVGGLVGATMLIAIVLISFARGSSMVRSLVIILVIFGNTFDFLRWPGLALIFFAVVAFAANPLFSRRLELDASTAQTRVALPPLAPVRSRVR